MIAIKKGKSPENLTTKGTEITAEIKIDFDAGTRKFEFDGAVYGAKTVKNALKKAQSDKCCFCEAHVSAVAHGDVEHFRPKGGWQQEDGDKLSEVGYYWLAYDWDNLFFSCQICNQTYKKNFFPLEDSTTRTVNHHGNIKTEKPLIINPVQDNPAEHLAFKKEFVKAKTPKGTETIKRTGIDRNSLDEIRREKMLAIKGQLQLLKLLDAGQIQNPDAQEVISNLRELVTPKKPFFAMLRDNFKTDLSKFGINICPHSQT